MCTWIVIRDLPSLPYEDLRTSLPAARVTRACGYKRVLSTAGTSSPKAAPKVYEVTPHSGSSAIPVVQISQSSKHMPVEDVDLKTGL